MTGCENALSVPTSRMEARVLNEVELPGSSSKKARTEKVRLDHIQSFQMRQRIMWMYNQHIEMRAWFQKAVSDRHDTKWF